MGLAQKWLVILGGLGALSLVVTNPKGFYTAATAVNRLTSGSITQITTQGKKGG